MNILRAAVAAKAALAVPSDRDCCVFARSVLEHTYSRDIIRAVPIERWHLWPDRPGVGPWEPVLAADDAGITFGEPSLPTAAPRIVAGRWHLCQGWRGSVARWPLPPGSKTTGHTWLWLAITDETGLVLDSTRSRGPKVSDLRTWADQASDFVGGVAAAALKRPRATSA